MKKIKELFIIIVIIISITISFLIFCYDKTFINVNNQNRDTINHYLNQLIFFNSRKDNDIETIKNKIKNISKNSK